MACDHARNQGTCKNRCGIKRNDIEESVLGLLKDDLKHPALVEEFVTALNFEIQRPHKERNATLTALPD